MKTRYVVTKDVRTWHIYAPGANIVAGKKVQHTKTLHEALAIVGRKENNTA